MDDIAVQKTVTTSTRTKVKKVAKKRKFGVYLFDWIVKGLIVALLLGINFVLFANSGNANFFSSAVSIAPHALYILIGITATSLLIMFLLSFSRTLQNLFVAVVVASFFIIMVNHFALFNKSSFLFDMLSDYIGQALASSFDGNSQIIIAGSVFAIAFLFMAMARKTKVAYLMLFLLIIFGWVLFKSYINFDPKRDPYIVSYKDENTQEKPVENPRKFVYIFMPNLPSYKILDEMGESSPQIKKAKEIMLAFYARNNFTVFPNAYIKENRPFLNMIKSLNPLDEKNPEDHMLKNISIFSYWQFDKFNDKYAYLRDNKLFDTFRDSGYKLTAYQSRELNTCCKDMGCRDNALFTDKCVEKQNYPVDVSKLNISVWDKTMVLFAQWVESMQLFPNYSYAYDALSSFGGADNTAVVGISYSGLYVVDSPKILDLLSNDIINAKENTAFFVFLDLPSDMYVYDEFCRPKHPSKWINIEKQPWSKNANINARKSALGEQTACLYGKLEEFINNLDNAGVLNNSVIVLQGLSNVDVLSSNQDNRNFIEEFKGKRLTTMAIRDPMKAFGINYEACRTTGILKDYLYKRGKCDELDDLNLQSNSKNELLTNLMSGTISQEEIAASQAVFDEWFPNWFKFNQNLLSKDIVDGAAPRAKPKAAAKPKEDVLKITPPAAEEKTEKGAVLSIDALNPEIPVAPVSEPTPLIPEVAPQTAPAPVSVQPEIVPEPTPAPQPAPDPVKEIQAHDVDTSEVIEPKEILEAEKKKAEVEAAKAQAKAAALKAQAQSQAAVVEEEIEEVLIGVEIIPEVKNAVPAYEEIPVSSEQIEIKTEITETIIEKTEPSDDMLGGVY